MPNRYACFHGHFYQPPRENPWLGYVETERSAAPFHDWNERITAECYGPCGALLSDGEALNLYSLISFNFGPTLLSWLETHSRRLYLAIQEADRVSRHNRSGHGNAIAQIYNHVIMPLASLRDKRTQVKWGVEDFVSRFGRRPEGIWLAETAADEETLEVLCEAGLRFTVLAPAQAAETRMIGVNKWEPARERSFDTTVPYRWFSARQPGRYIDLFFYSPALAQAVYLNNALNMPDRFYGEIAAGFSQGRRKPQLVHLAADGEYYGHHVKSGGATLAAVLARLAREKLAAATNYGEFLEKCPPEYEARIVSPSSWSCVHGVERWRGSCGCSVSPGRGWDQNWRKPLREAMDWLACEADSLYEAKSSGLLKDPWLARDGYISRLGCCDMRGVKQFLSEHAARHLNRAETTLALNLLEMQRYRLLMYTSCGWFFDEISGIEPVQIMKYAARAAELAGLSGKELAHGLEERLSACPSNLKSYGDGGKVYAALVAPHMRNLDKLAAGFCIFDTVAGSPPFSEPGRAHYKIVADDSLPLCRALYFHAERADTLEQAHFSAFVVLSGAGAVSYLKRAPADAHAVVLLSAGRAKDGAALYAVLTESGYAAFDASALPGDVRALFDLFAHPGETGHARLKNWVLFLKQAASAGKLIDAKTLERAGELANAGVAPAAVPFCGRLRAFCADELSLALDSRSPDKLARIEPWIAFFTAEGFAEDGWDFRLVLNNFLSAGGAGGPAGFTETLFKIKSLLKMGKTHGHKKNKA